MIDIFWTIVHFSAVGIVMLYGLLFIFKKMDEATAASLKEAQSPSPLETHNAATAHSLETPYRTPGTRPCASDPSAEWESLKVQKPRPFVPGQEVLVRLSIQGKDPATQPWFTATFKKLSVIRGTLVPYVVLVTAGSDKDDVFLLSDVTLRHSEN